MSLPEELEKLKIQLEEEKKERKKEKEKYEEELEELKNQLIAQQHPSSSWYLSQERVTPLSRVSKAPSHTSKIELKYLGGPSIFYGFLKFYKNCEKSTAVEVAKKVETFKEALKTYRDALDNSNSLLKTYRVEGAPEKSLMNYESPFSSFLAERLTYLLWEHGMTAIHQLPAGFVTDVNKTCDIDIGIRQRVTGEVGGDIIGAVEVKMGEEKSDTAVPQLITYLRMLAKDRVDLLKCPILVGAIIEVGGKFRVYGVRFFIEGGNETYSYAMLGECRLDNEYFSYFIAHFVNLLKMVSDFELDEKFKRLSKIPIEPDEKEYEQFGINVYRMGTKVAKVYDYSYGDRALKTFKDKRQPNINVIKQIDEHYLTGLEEKKISDDLIILKYDFIKGNFIPKSPKQLAKICRDLCSLHGKGFVHGDIRFVNFVFPDEDTGKAYLIDFDFAGEYGELKYPEGYSGVDQIKERHEGAVGEKFVLKDHDRYSLLYIIKRLVKFNSEHKIMKEELKVLAKEENILYELADELEKELKLVENIEFVIVKQIGGQKHATGSPKRKP